MVNLEKISETIYNYEMEIIYWNKYIINLMDFIYSTNPTPKQRQQINNEIVRVDNYKKYLGENITQIINQKENI